MTLYDEINKDEKLIDKMNEKKHAVDPLKSISIKCVDNEFGGVTESVWKVTNRSAGHGKNNTKYICRHMHIQSFSVKLTYGVSKALVNHFKSLLKYEPGSTENQADISDKYKSSLLNFIISTVSISDMKIKFKEYKLSEGVEMTKAISSITQFYLNDLIYNQKLNIIAGLYPVRLTINIAKAFAALVQHPMNSYFNERYILVGVMQGVTDFFSRISHEFGDIGARIKQSFQ